MRSLAFIVFSSALTFSEIYLVHANIAVLTSKIAPGIIGWFGAASMMKSLSTAVLLGALAALSLGTAARADTVGEYVTYTFTDCNAGLGCGTGNTSPSLGTVTITYEGANTLKVDADLNSGAGFVQTDHKATFSFSLASGLSPTVSGVSTGWTPQSGAPTLASGYNPDGMGTQAWGLYWGGGSSTPDYSDLIFDLTATGLTLENSFVLGGTSGDNGVAYYFVADVCMIVNASCSNTGQIGGFSVSPPHFPEEGVPGPLAGAGLPGLVFATGSLLAWWRRRRSVSLVDQQSA